MPLLALAAQLNSTCNLKSWNVCSWMISGPCPGLTSVPFSTFQTAAAFGSLIFQPVKSFPLNSDTGFPHFGVFFLWRSGAGTPDQVHGPPFGPVTDPERVLPSGFPTKTQSAGESSSSFGETKVTWPSEISTLGRERAFPQRPTICAASFPSSSRISSHEGYSRSGALRVRSQRPRKGLAATASGPELSRSTRPLAKVAEADTRMATRMAAQRRVGKRFEVIMVLRWKPVSETGFPKLVCLLLRFVKVLSVSPSLPLGISSPWPLQQIRVRFRCRAIGFGNRLDSMVRSQSHLANDSHHRRSLVFLRIERVLLSVRGR